MDKFLQKWNTDIFENERQNTLFTDSVSLPMTQVISAYITQNIFADYTTVCQPFVFWLTFKISYTLYIENTIEMGN